MEDNETRIVPVTEAQCRLLMALQRGGRVYRPPRRKPGSHHLEGRVKILEEGRDPSRVQDCVADTLVSQGMLEVTATRVEGGFRLDYLIPAGIELIGITPSKVV